MPGAANITVRGLDTVQDNLNNLMRRQERATLKGLLSAGFFVQRESQKIVPIDTGNLKAGASTRPLSESAVQVGYEAEYALEVHENLQARRKGGKPAKFLQTAIQKNTRKILELIASKKL